MLGGRVDELREGVAHGWAADPDRPNERADIKVVQGGRTVAVTRADLLRRDLADGHLGDGRHAFRIEFPTIVANVDTKVFASLAGEPEVELPLADPAERHLERLFDMFSQRFEVGLRTLGAQQARLRDEVGAIAEAGAISQDLQALSAKLSAFEARLDELDVFVVRIDAKLRAIDERTSRPERRGLLRRLLRFPAA